MEIVRGEDLTIQAKRGRFCSTKGRGWGGFSLGGCKESERGVAERKARVEGRETSPKQCQSAKGFGPG